MKRLWVLFAIVISFLSACRVVFQANMAEFPFVPNAKHIAHYYDLDLPISRLQEQAYHIKLGRNVFLFEYAYDNSAPGSRGYPLEFNCLVEIFGSASTAQDVVLENLNMMESEFLDTNLMIRDILNPEIRYHQFIGQEYFLDGTPVGGFAIIRYDRAILTLKLNQTEDQLPHFYDYFISPLWEDILKEFELLNQRP